MSDPRAKMQKAVDALRQAITTSETLIGKDSHTSLLSREARIEVKLEVALNTLTALSALVVVLADAVIEEEDAKDRRRAR